MCKAGGLKIILFLLLSSLFFLTCEKEAVPESKAYPYVITLDIENNDGTGITLLAEITDIGNDVIEEYGFVFSKENNPTIDSYRIEIITHAKVGEYRYRISNGLEKGMTYSVRAYIRTKKYLVYGNEISFESKGSLAPIIYSFTPDKGHAGTYVEITGENFSSIPELNIVKFGNKTAIIDSISEGKLFVRAPVITETKDVTISVSVANMEIIANKPFEFYFSWYKKNNFNSGNVYSASSFTINNKGYLFGGFLYNSSLGSNYRLTKRLWEFDILNNSWIEKMENPYEFYGGTTSFSYNNRGYIITPNGNKEICEYNSDMDSWSILTNYPGKSQDLISFVIDDELFTGLGTDFLHYYNEFYKYNLKTKVWTKLRDFPGISRYSAIAFTINGKGYIGTGKNYQENKYLNDLWEYDPILDEWTKKADFPGSGRYMAVAFTLKEKGYVGLGTEEENHQGYSDFWCYDPVGNSWQRKDDYIGLGKWGNVVFSNENRVFVGPGAITALYSSWSIWQGYNDLWEFKENEY